jgi:histidinol-phosphatase (PHP family)
MPSPHLISLHGGHSGEFCQHAEDSLAEVVAAYVKQGFSRVGITEHMPPPEDRFLYPDEREAGLTAMDLSARFDAYIKTCRELQKSHAPGLKILVGFETETYSGSIEFAQQLIQKYHPDYVVGSVHHVDDINFDFDEAHYRLAVRELGSLEALYNRYFDQQYEMITRLKPGVVGHFDLVRLYDPDYPERMGRPDIAGKIERNLAAVKELGLILDLNMRALHKGAPEPYPTRSILEKALEMGITVVPGDDSHGVATVGKHIETGISLLNSMGAGTEWEPPDIDRLLSYAVQKNS